MTSGILSSEDEWRSNHMNSAYERIYQVVRRIPKGRVATYGQIAELAGIPGHPRQVGYALHALTGDESVPWHRVINAKGEVSPRGDGMVVNLQKSLLKGEGVEFIGHRISLDRFRWKPRTSKKPR